MIWGVLGVSRELIFFLRMIGLFIDSKFKGRLFGKIIADEIGMELSCNYRFLEKILGDFLSYWVVDIFLN